jgi:hypothetical protein
MERRLWGALLVAMAPFLFMAASPVTPIDGKRMHVFHVSSGTDVYVLTDGGTTTLLGTSNANDFDFNDDTTCDWAKVTGIGWHLNGAGGGLDTLGYHGQSGGSGGGGWHETSLPPGADFIGIDMKLMREIQKMGTTSKKDTVLRIKASTGDIDLVVTGG